MNNSIIIGCILGDQRSNRYGTLTLEHSIKQSDYIYWKYAKLKELNFLTETSEPKLVTRIHPKTKKETKSLRFNTKSLFKPSFIIIILRFYLLILKPFVLLKALLFGLWMMVVEVAIHILVWCLIFLLIV